MSLLRRNIRFARPVQIMRLSLFLFLIGTLGLVSCSQLMFWRSVSKEEIRNAEEQLIQRIEALLESDPEIDPGNYHDNRVAFERALAAYIAITGKRDRSIIHVDYKGANVIIPVRRIGYYDDLVEGLLADTVGTIWRNVGPVFRDEIIDITTIKRREGYVVAALFSDSIAFFPINDYKSTSSVLHFPRENIKNIRSQKPAGIIDRDSDNKYYFLTTHLDTVFKIDALDSNELAVEYEYPVALSPVAGRSYFLYNREGITHAFSVRDIADDDRTIVLDNRGFLYLKANEDESIIWRSDRSWGDRLFRLEDKKFAVSHPYDNRFMLFEVQPERIDYKGLSPRFHGRVGAITGIMLAGRNGYLASITTEKRNASRYSQLHFVPEEFVRWHDPETISQPVFPDYDSRLVIADNIGDIFDRAHIERNLSQVVWNNIYETMFRYNAIGDLEHNLAASISSDENQRQWTVQLKPDVRFSDGTYLSAEIVRDAWMRNFDVCEKKGCTLRWLSINIDDIRIIDNHTFEIHLDRALPNFPEHLTAPCFQVAKESDQGQWLIGTGPYIITDADRPQSPRSVVSIRNPFFHGGLPMFEEVIFIDRRANIIDYLVDRSDAGALLRNPRAIDFFRGIDDYREVKAKNESIYFLALNPGSPRLRSLDSRKRIVNAFERQAVVTVVTEARSELAVSFFKNPESYEKTVFPRSTLPGGNSLRIYYTRQDPVAEQIALRFAVRLQQEGIAAQSPTGLSMERLQQIRAAGQYDILIDSFLPRFSSDVYNMYDLLQRGYLFDEYLNQKADTLLVTEGDETILEIEQYLVDQRYLYTLIRTSLYAIVPRELNDIEYLDLLTLDLSRAWFPNQ